MPESKHESEVSRTPDGPAAEPTTLSAAGSNWRRTAAPVLGVVVLVGLTVAAYWGIRKNSFISFDDPYYITYNYHVKHGLTLEGLRWAFCEFYASNWHPLTWLSHMADVELFGLNPAGHHLMSLGFHILNALLLLAFLAYTTRRFWASLFVAAMFALHPLHVESVAWAAERKDVLSTCFWLLVMLAYAWYAGEPSAGRYILAIVLYAMGLMAKPMLVTLPVVMVLLDYWPLQRIPARQPKGRRRSGGRPVLRLLLEKLPFAALAAGSAVMTILAQQRAINPVSQMGFWTLLSNALVSYGRYVWMMLWPSGLTLHYPHPHRPLTPAAICILAAGIAATFLVLRHGRKYPYLATGWFWYIVTLIPVIGIVQVGDQSHADRYTYIPLTGLFIIAAWGAGSIVERLPRLKTAFAILAAVLTGIAAVATAQTVANWRDNVTVFSHALDVTTDNAKMESLFGACLASMGRQDEAIEHLEKAARSTGNDGSPYSVLAIIYLDRGDHEKAMKYFAAAARFDWVNTSAEYSLGALLVKFRQFARAEEHLRRAVALDPYSAEAYSIFAVALSETGKLDEAAEASERAMKLDPNSALVQYGRGYVLTRQGRYPEAVEAFLKSVAIKPGYMTYGELGNLLFRMGRLEDAAQSYRRAIELDPNRTEAHFNLAFMLERLGKKEEAMAALKRVLEIDPNDAEARAAYDRLIAAP